MCATNSCWLSILALSSIHTRLLLFSLHQQKNVYPSHTYKTIHKIIECENEMPFLPSLRKLSSAHFRENFFPKKNERFIGEWLCVRMRSISRGFRLSRSTTGEKDMRFPFIFRIRSINYSINHRYSLIWSRQGVESYKNFFNFFKSFLNC
jgi:hypothetical protein